MDRMKSTCWSWVPMTQIRSRESKWNNPLGADCERIPCRRWPSLINLDDASSSSPRAARCCEAAEIRGENQSDTVCPEACFWLLDFDKDDFISMISLAAS